MNIIERYVCSYIVECLTGITGESQSFVHEILLETNAKFENQMLNEVLQAVKQSPLQMEDRQLQNHIRLIVYPYILANDPELLAIVEESQKQNREWDSLHTLIQNAEANDVPTHRCYILPFGKKFKAYVYDIRKNGMVKVATGIGKHDKLVEMVKERYPRITFKDLNIESK